MAALKRAISDRMPGPGSAHEVDERVVQVKDDSRDHRMSILSMQYAGAVRLRSRVNIRGGRQYAGTVRRWAG